MASVGKIALSLASGTQDATLALANINFDFSMVKLTAPTEYQGLGASISHKRKRKAEDGSTHITARRLGALFADDLPSTPNLAHAYGLRVSEIAENPKLNPWGSRSDGPLADLVGADGTSIWAAATSGKGAVAVHLLACMLARIWPGPEATSIWWLRTADTAKRRQQTQLMLIIDNIQSAMPMKAKVYDSVMEAWKKAMTIVDKLISGIAQDVQSPETLLGISTWHLYPDMFVLGKESTHVRQDDGLIQPGVLITIGSHHAPTNDLDRGLSWSMPLAHLLYYGKPVVSKRSFSSKSPRVPFERLLSVALGSLINTWGLLSSDPERIAAFMVLFCDCLDSNGEDKHPWITLLAQCAKSFILSSGKRKIRAISLHYSRPTTVWVIPGSMRDLDTYLKLLNPEERIAKIRYIARTSDFGVDITEAFIRYRPESKRSEGGTLLDLEEVTRSASRQGSQQSQLYEYATLFAQPTPDGQGRLHRRWIEVQTIPDHEDIVSSGDPVQKLYINRAVDRSIELIMCTGEACGFLNFHAVKHSDYRPNWEVGSIVLSWWEQRYPLDTAGLVAKAKQRFSDTDWAASGLLITSSLQLGALSHAFESRHYSSFLGCREAQIFPPFEKWKSVHNNVNPE
ncbi:hypothetical protein MMC18_006363 [Xylographa bjoerkii]|nr:hypothetical protein [Xylographa bjoerkii]